VKLSRVVGVPDERLGQVVVACVVLRDGQHATEDGIRSFLRDRVAAYKVPRHVLFLEEREVPMTGGDAKVRDDGLVRLVQERLGAVGAASEGGP
jgi:fatty-acyl-CoA synthase